MKQFSWPLQKLLDVTLDREQVLKLELAKMAAEISRLTTEAQCRRVEINRRIAELQARALVQRLERREMVMRWSLAQEAAIEKLLKDVRAIEERRGQTMDQYMALRTKRQGLERLREQSQARWRRQVHRHDQVRTDEAAQVAHLRRQLQVARRTTDEVTL